MLRTIALGAAATALLASVASAHHPSGASPTSGAGPVTTISATTLDKGQSVGAVVVEVISLNPLTPEQMNIHPHPHSLDGIFATSLAYAYGITDDLTLSLRLPFVRRTNIVDAHEGDLGDAAGIGDLSVLAQYRFYNNRAARTEAALLLGAELPTGDTSVNTALGGRFEAEFQPGSGAWDGMLGFALTQRFDAWSFDTNVLYQLTGEGVQSTNLGDRLLYNAAVSYRLYGFTGPSDRRNAGALPEPMYHGGPGGHAHKHAHEEAASPRGPALDLVLEVNGEWHQRQEIAGVADPNSGGNVVLVSPGLRLSYERWSGFVSVGVPVVNELNGVQAEPEWRVLTGVAVNF